MNKRFVFLIAKLLPNLLGVITTALLTRVLPPSDYGLYTFGLSIIYFMTIGTFEWMGLSLLRMAATVQEPELFYGTIMSCFCTTFLACSAAIGFIMLTGLTNNSLFLFVCLIACFGSAWTELQQRLQLAELRASAFFVVSFGRGLLTVTLVPAVAYWYHDATLVLVAFAIANILPAFLANDRRLGFVRLRFDSQTLSQLLRFGLPLSISVGLATLLSSMDKWMLGALNGTESIGLFSAAAMVAQMPVLSLASGIGPSAYAMAVRAKSFGSAEDLDDQLRRTFILLLGLVLPAALGIVGLSKSLSHILVGPLYSGHVVTLAPWLAAMGVISSMRAFYADIAFQLEQKTTSLIWTMVLAVIVNGSLGLVLIPHLGPKGAAISSFCAAITGLLASAALGRRHTILPIPFPDTIKLAVSALVMFFVVDRLPETVQLLQLLFEIVIGVAVFGGSVLLLDVMGIRRTLIQLLPMMRNASQHLL
ncbi:MAG TPA: oligosaccharide flippase family protein [Rhodopila sp.]|uniref:lipopolysaccharide biosynthesis protein n=1 Tax=Rhodopila sp. TaxID=2480087 RepID=UPI002C476A3D|nr:oligosaccharide flippase family protein [Rhodopila sp.]HVY16311.1 oligosaccharide flippase family protein [Rhodopila sp.]